jgi:hypothetical protein
MKWEYMKSFRQDYGSDIGFNNDMERFGKLGWECFAVIQRRHARSEMVTEVLYWKRPIREQRDIIGDVKRFLSKSDYGANG